MQDRGKRHRPESLLREKGLKPSAMTALPSKDPLHGVTLEMMLTRLSEHYGWEEMGRKINIRCFNFDPSIKSSLQFLRKTPWARAKVEDLYLKFIRVGGMNKTASELL